MFVSRWGTVWVGAAIIVAAMSGCSSEGVLILHQGEIEIEFCPGDGPITVESLDTDTLPECLTSDVPLVFPDGTTIDLPSVGATIGGTRGPAGLDHTVTSVGVYGLYASQSLPDCTRFAEWGTAQAKQKILDAFGANNGCVPRDANGKLLPTPQDDGSSDGK